MILRGTNKEAVVQFVTTRWDELKRARAVKENIWIECLRAYLSAFTPDWVKATEKTKRSRRYIPVAYDAIEILHAQLLKMLMPNDKWLSVVPAVKGRLRYDDDLAEEVRKLLELQMDACDFVGNISPAVKQLLICGNSPVTVGWRKEYAVDYPAYSEAMKRWTQLHAQEWAAYQREMDLWREAAQQAVAAGTDPPPPPQGRMPEPPPANMKLAYSGPTVETGDIFNFVIDPLSPDPRSALRIKRSYVALSQIHRLAVRNDFGYAVYENVDDVYEQEAYNSSDDSDNFIMERAQAFGLEIPKTDMVELHEAWGTMEIPEAMPNRRVFVSFVATVANRTTLIRFEPTFLWSGDVPVQLATLRALPGEVYGIGVLEPLLGYVDLINARANQAVDVVAYAINGEYKAVNDGVIKKNMVSSPGKIHWVGSMNNLEPLPKDLRGVQISMQDLEMLKREFTVMARAMTPLGAMRGETATRTALDNSVVGADIVKLARNIERTLLKPVLDLFLQLDAQYLTDTELEQILQQEDTELAAIKPEALRKGWAVRLRGSQNTVDRVELIQNSLMFTQLALGNPLTVPAINVLEWLKKLYQTIFGDSGDDVFNDAETAQMILDQMLRHGMLNNEVLGSETAAEEEGSSESEGSDEPGRLGSAPTAGGAWRSVSGS